MDNACIILIMRKAWEGVFTAIPRKRGPWQDSAVGGRTNCGSVQRSPRPPTQKALTKVSAFCVVGGGGFAPWADAHRKQRVSAVLSSVETSDLRRKTSPCLPSNPLISSPKKSPCVQTMLSAHKGLVEIRGLEPLTYTLRTYRATNCAISPYDFI